MKKLVNKVNIIIGTLMVVLVSLSICLLFLNKKANLNKNESSTSEVQKNDKKEDIDEDITTEIIEETTINTTNVENDKNEKKTSKTITSSKDKDKTNIVGTTTFITKGTSKTTKTTKTTKTIKTSQSTTTIKTQEQKNNEFRNKLLSKYNVIVGYKDEVDGVYKNSYASPRKIYDDEVISYNLTKIEDALKKYPKSFFSEIKNKWKPISIYLVDYINGYAGGVTDNNNSSTLVILIVATHSPKSSILENTVHHELMHAIDCYFTSKGIYSSYTLEQSIAKYNPEGFSYGVQDNKYVYLLDNPYYFVSKYAKSAYNEDRAEIFSNLMYRSYAPAYLKAGQPINEKAKVITNQINQNFNSASSGNNRWDKLVAH